MPRTTHLLTAFVLAASTLAVSMGGCELIATVDRSKLEGTGGTGGSGTGGTGGGCSADTDCPDPGVTCEVAACASGACGSKPADAGTTCDDGTTAGVCDGNGACVQCNDAADCPDTGNECVAATCDGNVCGTMNVAVDTPTMTQTAGDCKVVVCDGNGSTTAANDDTDAPDDGTACTTDSCANGSGVHTPTTGPCTDNGGTVCADLASANAGKCVECNVDADCTTAGEGCDVPNNNCVPITCMNNTQDGNETDEDCGGPVCSPCADNLKCLVPSDCQSGVCSGNPLTCQPPSCDDTVENGDETDVDCGGSCAQAPDNKKCADGDSCLQGTDCQSGVCGGVTCQAPTCNDGVKNGTEGDTDCGATCGLAKLCPNTNTCGNGLDCQSGFCNGGVCAPCGVTTDCSMTSYCNNGVCVPDQVNGLTCTDGAECQSGNCIDGRCCGGACQTCEACNVAGSEGTCSPIPAGQPDTDSCDAGGTKVCNGMSGPSACKGKNGVPCSGGSECVNGNCVDGVCCDTACTGTCQACNLSTNGNVVGTCGNIAAGNQDANATTPCDGNNACDGNGACKASNGQPCANGTTCGSGFCNDGVCCDTACDNTCFACNASGVCSTIAKGQTDTNATVTCTGTNACNGSGTCGKIYGETCAGNAECYSGRCSGNPSTCRCNVTADCPAGQTCNAGPGTCGP
jgi:hypothetical protein